MKILIISQYYWPENFRINEIASLLKLRGHNITVLTGIPNYPSGKFFKGYGFLKNIVQNIDGIKIIRAPLIPRGNNRFQLFLNYLSFTFFSAIYSVFLAFNKYDVCFVFEVSPIFIGIPAIIHKMLRKVPIVFWVLDLWPESLQSTNTVNSSFIIRFVDFIVKFIYRHCDKILISSKGFRSSIVKKNIENDKILYYPNMVETLYFQSPKNINNALVNIFGFKIVFAGNIGVSQDFPNILDACEMAKDYKDIKWIFLGDGRMKEWVQKEIIKRQLSNVHLLGNFPNEEMPGILFNADALLVSLKKSPNFELTVPGKIQTYMASGKPIIAMMNGEGANMIKEAKAGFTGEAENSNELFANVIKMYKLDSSKRKELGENGKKFSLENFAPNLLIDRLEKILKSFSK